MSGQEARVKIYNSGRFEELNDGRGVFNFAFNGDFVVLPGLVDVHVHLREPGFSFKEDMASGTAACARGGYSAVCSMPNLNPVPDSLQNLREQFDAIKKKASVRVYPYGAITVGERGERLADLEGLAPYVIAFSDDGKGVDDDGLMLEAMQRAKSLGKIIAAHCEDKRLIGGCINDCEYAVKHALKPLPAEAEWRQIARDAELVAKTGVSYHVCHVSAKESVEIIRQMKRGGLDVTCETAPHYLTLTDAMLENDGRFKMNPPLRAEADRIALIEGIEDGTVDMIATDHAPHTAEEKSRGLKDSLFGIVGIETAFSVMYTYLVKEGVISLEKLVELMSISPARRFGIKVDMKNDYSIFELSEEYTVNSNDFASRGRSTPYEGKRVYGKCVKTVIGGETVWKDATIVK
ncbi:MAG: dihydroorotase [Clostridia bacterium]|nr:dihydroorotase [Clostridia bacterium]